MKKSIQIKRYAIDILEDAFAVGIAGSFTAQKASDIFVKAAKIIKAAFPNEFFLMVGDGDL